jgi:hypothetical protein
MDFVNHKTTHSMKTNLTGIILICGMMIGNTGLAENPAVRDDDPESRNPAPIAGWPDSGAQPFSTDIFGNSDPWFVPEDSPLKRFYAGVAFGGVFTDYSDTVDDGSVSSVDDEDIGTAATFFFGYRFNDNVSVEAGYSSWDNVDFSAVSDGTGDSWTAGQVGAEFEADVFALVLVGRYPLAPRWTLIGKIGFIHWETTETYYENGFISVDEDNGNSAMIAGAIEYDLGLEQRFKLLGEVAYQRFDSESLDAIGVNFALIYEFP